MTVGYLKGDDSNGARNDPHHAHHNELADAVNEGGGGGSQPVVKRVSINGIVKDFSTPGGIENVGVLLIDAGPKPWEAGKVYSTQHPSLGGTDPDSKGAWVTPTGNPSVNFIAKQAASAVSGLIEPTWPTEDGAYIDDGDVTWQARVLTAQAWTATHDYASDDLLVVDGFLLTCLSSGTSGSEEPDWSSFAFEDTITDGDATWNKEAPCATWQAAHEYLYYTAQANIDYYSDWVLPTTPAGFVFVFIDGPSRFVESGDVEPDWSAADESMQFTDGKILWAGTDIIAGQSPTLYLTGIVAPESGGALQIGNSSDSALVKLYSNASAVSAFGADTESDSANTFDAQTDLNATEGCPVPYDGSIWRHLGPLGSG